MAVNGQQNGEGKILMKRFNKNTGCGISTIQKTATVQSNREIYTQKLLINIFTTLFPIHEIHNRIFSTKESLLLYISFPTVKIFIKLKVVVMDHVPNLHCRGNFKSCFCSLAFK